MDFGETQTEAFFPTTIRIHHENGHPFRDGPQESIRRKLIFSEAAMSVLLGIAMA
jgi:hypothetical protein